MPYRPTHSFTPARLRGAGLALAAALLLTGCQGGTPSPPSTTTAEPTSSATATGAPTPGASDSGSAGAPSAGVYKPADAKGKAENVPVPVMPELAKENSKEGLEAFIRYWYATYSYATETGDIGPWSALTDTSTTSGMAYRDAIVINYSSGRWVAGGKISTPVIEVLWTDGTSEQSAKVQVVQDAIRYFNADGGTGQAPTPSSNFAEAVMVSYAKGAWSVTDNGVIVG